MNIIELSDEDILKVANPYWDDLVKYSHNKNYGAFTRNFAHKMKLAANEVEMGKQFAKSTLTKNLTKEREYLGIIRRGEHVTVLFKQTNKKKAGEWLGRLVLGFEEDEIKIFGATLF
ncbi:MAG: hypothetical protein KAG28_01845 [Cocleimonas sp.]|nr:hypothetical protein [Cocleimonas sp.]